MSSFQASQPSSASSRASIRARSSSSRSHSSTAVSASPASHSRCRALGPKLRTAGSATNGALRGFGGKTETLRRKSARVTPLSDTHFAVASSSGGGGGATSGQGGSNRPRTHRNALRGIGGNTAGLVEKSARVTPLSGTHFGPSTEAPSPAPAPAPPEGPLTTTHMWPAGTSGSAARLGTQKNSSTPAARSGLCSSARSGLSPPRSSRLASPPRLWHWGRAASGSHSGGILWVAVGRLNA